MGVKQKIAIFIKASNSFGMGHYYRSIRLKHRLESTNSVTIILLGNNEETKNANLTEIDYHFNDTDFNDTEKLLSFDMYIFDLLNGPINLLKLLRSKGKKIISIDDSSKATMYANVVINALVERPFKTENFTIYHGSDYITYSPKLDFLKKNPVKLNSKKKQILVSFGGSDPNLISLLILPVIKKLEKYNFHLVLGPAFNEKEMYVEKSKGISNLKTYTDISDISDLISISDVCIVSGGLTMFEALYLNKCVIVASQVEHQLKNVENARKYGEVFSLGIIDKTNSQELFKIKDILESYESGMIENSRNKMENGMEKIINIIEQVGGNLSNE